ncbi:MAG: class I SAM-dependent methyltransferase [Thermoplasmata archaeon]
MAEEHWTVQLFLEHPDRFLPIHEAGLPYGPDQVTRLEQILQQAGVRGRRLLDAPSGIGRHAVHFAKRGWRVVGLELVPAYVRRATDLAEELGVEGWVTFLEGDLREVASSLHDEEPFDAIVNLLTSLGYWDDATDLAILRQFHDLASPGGVLVLDVINRDFVIRHFEPTSFEEYGTIAYRERRTLDLATSRIESRWTFYRKEGDSLTDPVSVNISQRVYPPHELSHLLQEAGWADVKVFGGWDLKPLSADQSRLLAVARK